MTFVRVACVFSVSLLAGCLADGSHPGQAGDDNLATPPSGPVPGDVDGGFVSAGPAYTEPLVVAASPPPPVSGGTLLVIAQGHEAAVADPDHDQVLIVDIDAATLVATIALQAGDEPGRLVEDGAGRIHVSLRSGGAVATIDPTAKVVTSRDAVCSYPRGLAYDSVADTVIVACAGGELVTLPAAGGAATRNITLADANGHIVRDLRDVVIDGDHVLVSRFHSAELLVLDASGSISATLRPKASDSSFEPAVAWRTMAAPGGGVIMLHQEDQTTDVQIGLPGGYGGFCGGIVRSVVSVIKVDGTTWSTPVNAVLPVDMALVGGDSPVLHVASAGARPGGVIAPGQSAVSTIPAPLVEPPPNPNLGPDAGRFCGPAPGQAGDAVAVGQVVAVATDPSGRELIQTREPAAVLVNGQSVALPGASRKDSGHDIFHLATMGGIACASCHPEGHEDGRVWSFAGLGPRRTQSIAGGILGTEPFHWGGDMKDFPTLSHDVFNGRMSGPSLEDKYVTALANWINTIPVQKAGAPRDPAAVERGRALFNNPAALCTTCHAGAKMTNNANADVGTGGSFQVPSLRGLAWRAPFMHDGCAPTISDRFGTCGGSKHGQVSTFDAGQKSDLVAYLETL